MNTPKTSSSGIFSFTNLWNIIKWCFSAYGMICLTMIVLIISSIASIQQSIKEKDPTPFLKNVGGKVLNFEQRLYVLSSDIEKNQGITVNADGFLGKIKAWWNIGLNIGNIIFLWWIMFSFLWIFYKISSLLINDETKVLSLIIMSLMMLTILEVASTLVILDGTVEQKLTETDYTKYLPFQGVIKSVSVLNLLFTPVYNKVEQMGNDI